MTQWEAHARTVFAPAPFTPNLYLASLEYAIFFMLIHAAIEYVLWKKKVYIKL